MTWQPSLGALPTPAGTRFRVWAPTAGRVDLIREPSGDAIALERSADGTYAALVAEIEAGDRYRYRVDDRGPFPDPASRSQPEGVRGPSEVVDPTQFAWTDRDWRGVRPEDLILLEVHVGTFTVEGTFEAAAARLPDLARLGVTAVELMPVNDFPGHRGWGYDGVDLFAPARCYGRPDDLRRFVDEAHRLGLAVLLDVVYNHLGPDGNYLAQFSPYYFSSVYRSPWGPAVNLDGEQSEMVRTFFLENALHWLHEYHLDGFRLDATHHLIDEGPRHFLAEFTEVVRGSAPDRAVHLIAEDPRNLASMLRAEDEGGWGLDAVWSDDFHHELRRYLVAGDTEGVFRDFRGSLEDLATTLNRGWLFVGAYSIHREYHRGSDPAGLAPRRFVFNIQNHDRIGNRALGERLNHQVDLATFRAATALLLCAPETPLLFQGQEWASSAPFLFFTDHDEPLGSLVREGRRREFRQYAAFADPERSATLPDLQAESTFLACKLDWSERDREPHASTLRFYEALLHLRRTDPALRASRAGGSEATTLDADTILLRREPEDGSPMLWLVVRLKGAGSVTLAGLTAAPEATWDVVLSSEEPRFATDPMPPTVETSGPAIQVRFERPTALLLRARPGPPRSFTDPTKPVNPDVAGR